MCPGPFRGHTTALALERLRSSSHAPRVLACALSASPIPSRSTQRVAPTARPARSKNVSSHSAHGWPRFTYRLVRAAAQVSSRHGAARAAHTQSAAATLCADTIARRSATAALAGPRRGLPPSVRRLVLAGHGGVGAAAQAARAAHHANQVAHALLFLLQLVLAGADLRGRARAGLDRPQARGTAS
jgi:hypothetical protein